MPQQLTIEWCSFQLLAALAAVVFVLSALLLSFDWTFQPVLASFGWYLGIVSAQIELLLTQCSTIEKSIPEIDYGECLSRSLVLWYWTSIPNKSRLKSNDGCFHCKLWLQQSRQLMMMELYLKHYKCCNTLICRYVQFSPWFWWRGSIVWSHLLSWSFATNAHASLLWI